MGGNRGGGGEGESGKQAAMNPNYEEAVFQLALSKPAAKRAAWLDAECEGGDGAWVGD